MLVLFEDLPLGNVKSECDDEENSWAFYTMCIVIQAACLRFDALVWSFGIRVGPLRRNGASIGKQFLGCENSADDFF